MSEHHRREHDAAPESSEKAPEHEASTEETAKAEKDRPEEAAAPVEALLGLPEFLALAPRRASAATTTAAHKALERWMRAQGHDVYGHYPLSEWQGYYEGAMQQT